MWVPVAFAGIAVLAYLLFYVLDSLESQRANAFGLANTIGLATVAIGIVVALLIFRRGSRPS
jgi:hypothetical protein